MTSKAKCVAYSDGGEDASSSMNHKIGPNFSPQFEVQKESNDILDQFLVATSPHNNAFRSSWKMITISCGRSI